MAPLRREASTWRRRWKRVPQERRAAAASSLEDIFRPRRAGYVLLVMLGASLAVHAVTAPFLLARRPKDLEQVSASEHSYLRKVLQRDRARHIAAEASKRITVPPPPPDPEKFVSETLAGELTEDLLQVTSGLLDVRLEESLIEHVQASLEDELREASTQIATGKLSKEEIKKLQRRFREKAMDAARDWREEHREEYQVPIAAKTVIAWYEERVASQISWAVRSSLFVGRRGHIWSSFFDNQYNAPGFIEDDTRQAFVTGRARLLSLATGRFSRHHFGKHNLPEGLPKCKDVGHGWVQMPGWPDRPSKAQAEIFSRLVKDYGRSWAGAFDSYAHDYYPHRRKEAGEKKAGMTALWDRLVLQTKHFTEQAKSRAPAAKLKGGLRDCLKTLKEFNEAWGKVLVGGARRSAFRTINRAVRSRVLRGPFRETAYRGMIDMLVAKLRPPVEQLAEGQFREGMVLSEKGVHEAMKKFRVKAVALLKRDMEEIISRPFFRRKLFDSRLNPYRNKITNESVPPTEEQIRADEAALRKAAKGLPRSDRAFVEARTAKIKEEINEAISGAIGQMLERILAKEGRLKREYYARAETVDYSDPFKQKLEARDMAWKGRKQDLADLTEEGVPDTSTPLAALASGIGTGQIALKAVVASMHPGYFSSGEAPESAVRWSRATAPPPPAEWGFVTQPKIKQPFGPRAFEAIPFLINFPNLDGDISDWGHIRPLALTQDTVRDPAFRKAPILVYAAWNYQGFFFGYQVEQPRRKFSLPSQYWIGQDGVTLIKDPRITAHNQFVERGDSFIVMIDTLDARLPFRGDPHTQEFYILPRGTGTDPDLPGAERVFTSRRYGRQDGNFGWGRRICHGKLFPPQPRSGPDGSGPYRVTKLEDNGYTVEVFLPRSIFKVPVFAPGWYIGFDCYVGTGKQPRGSGARFAGKGWAHRPMMPCFVGNNPSQWGDLLLLGTDARVSVQDAAPGWPRSTVVFPGHSYLITVVDPDRNVHLTGIDTVLVSAEVIEPSSDPKAKPVATDVELYILKETGNRSSTFRGYIDTQPGTGSKVRGSLELLPGSEVRFRYVDFADSKGRRNVVYEQRLPVVSRTLKVSRAGR